MIDGIIETLFSGANVSADVRDAYLLVHRHLTEDALEVKDFKRIANAMEFAMKNQFCDSCSRESQRVFDKRPYQGNHRLLNRLYQRIS